LIQNVLAQSAFLEMVSDRFEVAAVQPIAKKPLE